jgi:hypothetical protein
MARKITFYTILGVAEDADAKTIKAAYRRWAKKYHPDVCDLPDATEYFKRINKAWMCLGDTGKRRKYDDALRRTREAAKTEEESIPPNWSWSPEQEASSSNKENASSDWPWSSEQEILSPNEENTQSDWSWSPPTDEDVYEGPLMWYESWRVWTGIVAAMLLFIAGLVAILSIAGQVDENTSDSVASEIPSRTAPTAIKDVPDFGTDGGVVVASEHTFSSALHLKVYIMREAAGGWEQIGTAPSDRPIKIPRCVSWRSSLSDYPAVQPASVT